MAKDVIAVTQVIGNRLSDRGRSIWQDATVKLAAATLVLLAVRFFVAAHTGLTDDEAYYRLWSLAPSLSFYDHPPMVAWLIGAGRNLAGDSETGVRFLAPILLAAGIAIAWRTAFLLDGLRTALVASWFLLAMPLLAVGGVIITPDLPSVFFFGLVILGLAELDRSQNANWWLAIGFFAGCGLLSKYTNFFAGVTILLWILAVPGNRKWLSSPHLWIGGAIALTVFAPVLVWNWQNDGASFAKQFGRVGQGRTFGLLFPLEMAGGFLALASPPIAVLSLIGLADVIVRGARWRESKPVLLAAAVVPMLLYFFIHTLHARVQANWLAPLYPPLAICAAIGLGRFAKGAQDRFSAAAIAFGFSITAVIYTHAATPLATLRKDPTAQTRGWGPFVRSLRPLLDANGARWIATSSYATTGQLAFAFRGRVPVAQFNERIRHRHLPLLAGAIYNRPALYVELERRASESLLATCFANVSRIATVRMDDGTAAGVFYAVYRTSEPLKSCAGTSGPPHAAP